MYNDKNTPNKPDGNTYKAGRADGGARIQGLRVGWREGKIEGTRRATFNEQRQMVGSRLQTRAGHIFDGLEGIGWGEIG